MMKDVYRRLANVLDWLDPDSEDGRSEDNSRVKLLRGLITERQAELCAICPWEYSTAEEIAELGSYKVEDIIEDLYQAAIGGVLYLRNIDGVDKFHLSQWMPGIMEHAESKMRTSPGVAEGFANIEIAENVEVFANVPEGGGIMRAIPIMESVDAVSEIASYEKIQTYLDRSDIYTAVDCECKLSNMLIGNPGIHPYEKMCIQIGEEAEYYIRTGRAERISREEVEEILKRAERYGLVHQIFNNEGAEKTSLICNCEGDSCGILKHLRWFREPDHSRSNYVSKINPEKCVACGACVEYCPMNAIKLGNIFCDLEGQVPKWARLPSNSQWTVDDINDDFRKRIMVNDDGTSPCKTQCPAHISIQGYIRKALEGNYMDALKIIKRDNPFPAVCGRICPHTCENECSREQVDEAIAIDDIKKFIADKELESDTRFVPPIYERFNDKVAVIGAGPAGLTCAYYLAAEGYPVTVFDRGQQPGGMLINGIPSFRLEKNILAAEIEVLSDMGVEFRNGVDVGKDVTIAGLRTEGYKAFYIAIGAQNGRRLNVEGEDLDGVMSGIDFLRNANMNAASKPSGDTLVIGGGNVAIDTIRTAVRLGTGTANMYCLETNEDMPAAPGEKKEALEEGITIHNSWGPKRIIGENGKVTGVEFMRCLSVTDKNGSFAPRYDENDTITVPCSNVLVSIGQSVDWGNLLAGTNVNPKGKGLMKVAEVTYQSGEADIFGGGDAVTGPKFVIDAIATGKSGAISIHRYLRGYNMTIEREREFKPFDKEKANFSSYEAMKRQCPPSIDIKKATTTLQDLRQTLTEEQLKKEAKRCLGCGVSIIDPYMCIGCGVCYTRCEFDAVRLEQTREVKPAETPEHWMMNVAEYAKKRYEKISSAAAEENKS